MSQEEPFTILIIAATAAITALAFYKPGMMQRLWLDNQVTAQRGDYLRLLSSGFVHGDWVHFAFNMFSFYSFAGSVEALYGATPLVIIYFGSMVTSGLFALWINRKRHYRAVGASGGVCGIIFGSIFLLPGNSIFILPIPFPIPSWAFAFIFLGVSTFAMGKSLGNISHEAHIGGAVSGMLIATALYPQAMTTQPLLFGSLLAFCALLWFLAPLVSTRIMR